MEELHGHGRVVVLLFLCVISIMISFTSTVVAKPNGFRVRMIPRDSPESPLYPGNLTQSERLEYLIRLSKDRVHALQLATSSEVVNANKNNSQPEIIRPSVEPKRATFYYMVYVRIGSQQTPFYLLLDTGSDLTWVQCRYCSVCFKLKGGNFRWFDSATYQVIDHDDNRCQPKISQETFCEYLIRYASGKSSAGNFSIDDFTFETDSQDEYETIKLMFGCGYKNRVSFGAPNDPENMIAGVFGIGIRSARSITAQLPYNRFSYCLSQQPLSSTDPSPTTYLHFGNDADFEEGRPVSKTPFFSITRPNIVYYYLQVVDMSVDGVRLNIPPDILRTSSDGRTGFIIDTGAPSTVLTRGAFDWLSQAVKQYFLPYNLKIKEGLSLPLCFRKPYRNFDEHYPTIKFHFENEVEFELHPYGAFFENPPYFCLSIASQDTSGISIIGAYQQINYKFLYDITENTLSFAPELCNYV